MAMIGMARQGVKVIAMIVVVLHNVAIVAMV